MKAGRCGSTRYPRRWAGHRVSGRRSCAPGVICVLEPRGALERRRGRPSRSPSGATRSATGTLPPPPHRIRIHGHAPAMHGAVSRPRGAQQSVIVCVPSRVNRTCVRVCPRGGGGGPAAVPSARAQSTYTANITHTPTQIGTLNQHAISVNGLKENASLKLSYI